METPTGTSNPSIAIDSMGRALVSLRNPTYFILGNEGKTRYFDFEYVAINTDNKTAFFIAEIDLRDGTISNVGRIKSPLQISDATFALEDLRLYFVGTELFATASCTENNLRARVVRLRLVPDGGGFKIKEIQSIRSNPDPSLVEKNYVPVITKAHTYIRAHQPTSIVSLNSNKSKIPTEVNYRMFDDSLRGSTQLIPYGDGYLRICHKTNLVTHRGKTFKVYDHFFASYDSELNQLGYGPSFTFLNSLIEFTCGFAILGNSAYITFSISDSSSYFLKFPQSLLFELSGESLRNKSD
jgi:hypothetical protein